MNEINNPRLDELRRDFSEEIKRVKEEMDSPEWKNRMVKRMKRRAIKGKEIIERLKGRKALIEMIEYLKSHNDPIRKINGLLEGNELNREMELTDGNVRILHNGNSDSGVKMTLNGRELKELLKSMK